MKTSESTDRIDAAMARVQASLKPVTKNKGVKVDGEKAKWESRFATLEALYEAAREALTAEGIAIYQGGDWIPGGGSERMATRLALAGQWIESSFPIKETRPGAQGFGGGVSFARRWGLCGMVGLVPADAEEQQGYRDERPARAQRPKSTPGLADRIARIADATSLDELARLVIEARSTHPLPEEATAVERATSAWFVQELTRVRNIDALTLLRDALNKVRPRGDAVREALRAAEGRLLPDVKS